MKHSTLFGAISICALALALSAKAVDDAFDPRIDAWAEGSIMALNADGATFSIRGTQRVYWTQYAKMNKEIHDKTVNLDAAAAQKKTEEIKTAWAAALQKAHSQEPAKESDFTFHVPTKDGTLVAYDHDTHFTKNDTATPPMKITDAERKAMHALKDFHVGDYVIVGYASGVVKNDAYVAIRAPKGTTKLDNAIAPDTGVAAVPAADKPAVDANTEQTVRIRRALVEDKSLSVAAKNIHIEVKAGVANLSGTVTSDTEKAAIESKAASIMGVDGKIVSSLKIKQ